MYLQHLALLEQVNDRVQFLLEGNAMFVLSGLLKNKGVEMFCQLIRQGAPEYTALHLLYVRTL
jgi:hypothetical protein